MNNAITAFAAYTAMAQQQQQQQTSQIYNSSGNASASTSNSSTPVGTPQKKPRVPKSANKQLPGAVASNSNLDSNAPANAADSDHNLSQNGQFNLLILRN